MARLTSVDNLGNPLGIPRTPLTSSYDASGRRTGLTATDPGNSANDDFVNTYSYDAAGRTTQVTQTGQAGGRFVADKRVDLDYDDLGRRETLTRYADLAGTALVAATGYAFDPTGRLTGLTHAQGSTPFADYGYVFDAAGRLIEESTLAETRKYYYDAGGQLAAVDSNLAGRDENYAYDRTGNRTSNGGQAGTGNRLAEDANYTYQYDGEGNRSQRTSKADGSREIYWWDHRNRLIRVNFRTSANVLTQSVAYAYDAYDNLIRRQVDGNGDGTFEQSQSFALDLGGKGGLDDVVLAFDESGNVAHRYLHGDGVDELWADESTTDGLLWALADRQGTVNDWAEHDSGTGTTTVTNHVEFDAYGNIVSQTNASHEITAGGYTGRYHDPLTGLRYHRRRWTDPDTGWLSPDPGGFAMGDVNLYRFVGNAPGNYTDPSGYIPHIGYYGVGPQVHNPPRLSHPRTPPRHPMDPRSDVRPVSPDIKRAIRSCGGDPACERALGTLFQQIAETPGRGFYKREEDKCFNWLDDFLQRHYPNYDPSDGQIPLEGGAIVLEPLYIPTRAGARIVTARSAFRVPTGHMTAHGVVRVTFNPNGKQSCMGYFDLGSSTDLGHYGGADHFFFPYQPGGGFELEMDVDKAFPYDPKAK